MSQLETLQREFPDYDVATLPPLPDDWRDISWHNDACPSFQVIPGYRVFTDYLDPAERESPELSRFTLVNDDTCEAICCTDDWPELLRAVAALDPPVAV